MTLPQLAIRQAMTPSDVEVARTLFLEYAQWLKIDLCFQGFNEELATLPGNYAPPSGRLFLAGDGDTGGCVAVRRLGADASGKTCELKRLWVRPAFRGRHAGRALTRAAFDAAREIGYVTMKLDTIPSIMAEAVAMYRSLGFTECAPYYRNPIAGTVYMTCSL